MSLVIMVPCAIFLYLECVWGHRYDIALHKAIIAQDIPAARKAFSEGANMSMNFRERGTFLHAVAYQGDVEMAKLLVEHGAAQKLYATDRNGDTAIDIALQNGHSQLADYLRSLIKTNGAPSAAPQARHLCRIAISTNLKAP